MPAVLCRHRLVARLDGPLGGGAHCHRYRDSDPRQRATLQAMADRWPHFLRDRCPGLPWGIIGGSIGIDTSLVVAVALAGTDRPHPDRGGATAVADAAPDCDLREHDHHRSRDWWKQIGADQVDHVTRPMQKC